MDFDLSADQEALRDAARDLLDDLASSEQVRAVVEAGGGHDPELWRAMLEQGWPGIAVPEDRGGIGLGTVEAAVLLEQSGAHVAPAPILQQLLAVGALLDTTWCEPLVNGEVLGTVAWRPVEANADGTLSGRTEPVVHGATADLLVTRAGDGLYLVDLRGMPRTAEPAMDRTRELAWITLEGTPATRIGDGDAATAFLDRGATLTAAEMLGAAERAMWLTVEYAGQREQFGKPIGSFQAVKHRCADMLVDVEGMRSATYWAAWAIGAGDAEASVAASTAKAWCSDAAKRVMASALQVHGGIGFTWECDVHLFLKRSQLDQVSFGDATFHRARLAATIRERLAAGASVI
jgi:alkylation response protein AidB-like acyl-CoA dehydrogenase